MVIRKLPNQLKWRLYSSKVPKKNLGTFNSYKAALKHEKQIQSLKKR